MGARPLMAPVPGDAGASSLTHFSRRIAFRATYALADLAIGRAVFDSQFFRSSSRLLST
jgi:hypothetical protein